MASKQEERFKAMRQEAEDNIKTHAARLFARNTFAKTTMQEVAKAAGVSTGLAYRYFSSKDDLFDAVISDAIWGLRQVTEAFRGDGDPKEIMVEVTQQMWSSLRDNPDDLDLFWLVSQTLFPRVADNKVVAQLLEVDREMLTAISDLITRGQELHEFKDGDSLALASLFVSSYQGLAMFWQLIDQSHSDLTPEIFLRFLFD